jgi:hypothetical protein
MFSWNYVFFYNAYHTLWSVNNIFIVALVVKETFMGQFEITNQEWQDDLKDSNSKVYKILKDTCTQIVSSWL